LHFQCDVVMQQFCALHLAGSVDKKTGEVTFDPANKVWAEVGMQRFSSQERNTSRLFLFLN